jgi:streptogramin lyase
VSEKRVHRATVPARRLARLVAGLAAALAMGLLSAGTVAGAGPACPQPLVERQRFGFVATSASWPQNFDFGVLKAGWAVDFAYQSDSAPPDGIDRALVIRIYDGYQVDPAQLGPLVAGNPGVTWLVGNEPDCTYQDDVQPEEYARIYHDLYKFIKDRDQTSQVAAGSIVQPTPLRLEWLNRVLAAYQAQYGGPMPLDVWNIHNAILNEVSCDYDPGNCWGAGIPPGIDAPFGAIRTINDNDNMTIFRDQIWAFRQWMAAHGYGGYPLLVTEYGVLMPDDYGFGVARVNAFMSNTFDFFLNTTDPTLGDPNDGRRLVQRWAWFSLDVPPFDPITLEGFNGNLFDPKTGAITAHGQHYASRTSSFPDLTYVDLGLGEWNVLSAFDLAGPGQTVTRTLQARIVNMGTADSGSFAVRLEYDGPATGILEQVVTNLPHASSQWLTFTLADLPAGGYSVSLWIDPGEQVDESRECNNQATTRLVAPTDRLYLPLVSSRYSGAIRATNRAAADSRLEWVDRVVLGDAAPGFQEFEVPTPASFPAQIALDAQGRLWVSERDANKIAHFDPQAEDWEEYIISTTNSQPWGLALDGDGNVWFAETAANKIGKLEVTSGVFYEYSLTGGSQPWDVAVGGDGTVWFTEKAGNKIGRLVPATGLITEYSLPTSNAEPSGIAVSSGEVWFTEAAANKLGRLKIVTGLIEETVLPTSGSVPQDIVSTSAGQPWLTEMQGNKIAGYKVATHSQFFEVPVHTAHSEPYGIAMEGNVAVWFTERAANKLGRYDARGLVFEYGLPTPNSSPTGIVVDGNACAWYTAPGANRIGRLCPPLNRFVYLPVVTRNGSSLRLK